MEKQTQTHHILIMASYAPSLTNFRGVLLQTLVDQGHQVTAVAPLGDLSPSEQDKIKEELQAMGVMFKPVALSRTGLNPLKDLSYLLALKKIIRQTRADRLLAYTIKPVIYGGLAARMEKHSHYYPMFTGLGYAFTKGSGLKKNVLRFLSTTLLKNAIRSARTVIFQNPDDQKTILDAGIMTKTQSTRIVNGSGVDLSRYQASPLGQPPEHISFLMIARILVDKGVREYAQAASRLKARYPDCEFTLVGPIDEGNPSSPSQAEIESWTAINYLGGASDVRPYLLSCDVYVLPSYREGTPRTVLEAMATERAIITTDAPGCRETVQHGDNGFLVTPRDSQSLEEAMEKFILKPELCLSMGRTSLDLVQKKYDVHLVNKSLLKIMDISTHK